MKKVVLLLMVVFLNGCVCSFGMMLANATTEVVVEDMQKHNIYNTAVEEKVNAYKNIDFNNALQCTTDTCAKAAYLTELDAEKANSIIPAFVFRQYENGDFDYVEAVLKEYEDLYNKWYDYCVDNLYNYLINSEMRAEYKYKFKKTRHDLNVAVKGSYCAAAYAYHRAKTVNKIQIADSKYYIPYLETYHNYFDAYYNNPNSLPKDIKNNLALILPDQKMEYRMYNWIIGAPEPYCESKYTFDDSEKPEAGIPMPLRGLWYYDRDKTTRYRYIWMANEWGINNIDKYWLEYKMVSTPVYNEADNTVSFYKVDTQKIIDDYNNSDEGKTMEAIKGVIAFAGALM